jgi:putative acetyltransferase
VAHLDGRAVACGGVRRLRDGIAEIKRMYVEPQVRGRGISRALLAALESAAREAGYREVWLETGLGQPEAMALYEASGYAPITPYGHYKDHDGSRCYAKRLK